MNKKLILVIIILLLLGGGFYLSQNYSKTPALETKNPPVEKSGNNITVDLSLKTSGSASESAAMKVELPTDSDHCEVLKKALEQGKITGLDMRYQEEYQTNGIYVINGIGKPDSPWWVYKINGSDASLGCSQIKVAPGDKILWEYLGT
jgi:hypothetical protein